MKIKEIKKLLENVLDDYTLSKMTNEEIIMYYNVNKANLLIHSKTNQNSLRR